MEGDRQAGGGQGRAGTKKKANAMPAVPCMYALYVYISSNNHNLSLICLSVIIVISIYLYLSHLIPDGTRFRTQLVVVPAWRACACDPIPCFPGRRTGRHGWDRWLEVGGVGRLFQCPFPQTPPPHPHPFPLGT